VDICGLGELLNRDRTPLCEVPQRPFRGGDSRIEPGRRRSINRHDPLFTGSGPASPREPVPLFSGSQDEQVVGNRRTDLAGKRSPPLRERGGDALAGERAPRGHADRQERLAGGASSIDGFHQLSRALGTDPHHLADLTERERLARGYADPALGNHAEPWWHILERERDLIARCNGFTRRHAAEERDETPEVS
jgi:hypothetical protein